MGLGPASRGEFYLHTYNSPFFHYFNWILHNEMKIQNLSQLCTWLNHYLLQFWIPEQPIHLLKKNCSQEGSTKFSPMILSPCFKYWSMYGVLQIFSTLQLSSTFWNVSCISNTLLPDSYEFYNFFFVLFVILLFGRWWMLPYSLTFNNDLN